MQSINTILFDYDSTLALLEEKKFAFSYVFSLYDKLFSEFPKEIFLGYFRSATLAMVNNDGKKTNLNVFVQNLSSSLNISKEEVHLRLTSYYQSDDFFQLGRMIKPTKGLKKLFEYLLKKDMTIAIACNPVFPTAANKVRMQWIGIDQYPIKLITSSDDFHYCKPAVGYYKEILTKLKRENVDCMMIGDNPVNDILPAKKIGLNTCLVKKNEKIKELEQKENDIQFETGVNITITNLNDIFMLIKD